jgi:hypothetical protein
MKGHKKNRAENAARPVERGLTARVPPMPGRVLQLFCKVALHGKGNKREKSWQLAVWMLLNQ